MEERLLRIIAKDDDFLRDPTEIFLESSTPGSRKFVMIPCVPSESTQGSSANLNGFDIDLKISDFDVHYDICRIQFLLISRDFSYERTWPFELILIKPISRTM